MDVFDSIKNKMKEARDELREKEEKIKDMSRGFDVLPDIHKGNCSAKLAVRRLFPLIVSTAFVAAAYFAYDYSKPYPALKWVAIAFAVLVGIYELRNLIWFLRFMFGFYDLYGGYVLDKKFSDEIEPRYQHRERIRRERLIQDGKGIHDYYHTHYYVNINGVTCRVRKSQYLLLKMNEYYYVIRIKNRYIENDDFFFIKADSSVEYERTGNHFPKDENRKNTPSGFGCIGTCAIVFGAVSLLFGLVTWRVASKPGTDIALLDRMSIGGFAVGGALVLIGIIAGIKRR